MSKYYPVGTIVKLNLSEDNLFMISGYFPKREDSLVYDYFAVPYPLGLIDETSYICFNSSSITEVVYEGYCDEQREKTLNGFDEMLSNIKQAIKKKSEEQVQ